MLDSLRRTLASEDFGGRVSEAGLWAKIFVLVALVALAISFFTTSYGFYNIFSTQAHWWAILIALGFGFLIQAVLGGSSWLLGQDIGRFASKLKHHRSTERSASVATVRILVTLAMFAPALALSLFLSFNTYFNHLYQGREEQRLQQARVPPFVNNVISDLDAQVKAARESARQRLEAETLSKWLPQLDTVAKEAGQAEAVIAQALKAETEERRKKIEAQVKEQQKNAAQRDEAKRRLVAAGQVLSQNLPEQIEKAEAEKPVLKSSVDALQAKKSNAEQRLWITLRRRDGTTHRVRNAKVAKELAGIRAELSKAIAAAAENDAKIGKWRRDDETAKAQRAEAISKLDTLPENDVTGGVRAAPDNVVAWQDVAQAVATLKRQSAELLKTPSEQNYNRAVETCDTLVKVLRSKKETATTVAGITCDPQARLAVQKNDDAERFRLRFEKECSSIDRNQTRSFDDALLDARKCRTLAQQGGVADLQKTNALIQDFQESYSTDRSEFSKTMSAFVLSAHMALLASLASLLQDLVLLGASIFVEVSRARGRDEELAGDLLGEVDLTPRPGDSPAVLCAKVVIGNMQPMGGDPPQFAFDLDSEYFESLPPGHQVNVRGGLASLHQQGLAEVDQTMGRTRYLMGNTAIWELRKVLRAYAAARKGAAAREAAGRPGRMPSAQDTAAARSSGSPAKRDGVMDHRAHPRQQNAMADEGHQPSRPTMQVYTPRELWRQDQSSIVAYRPAKRDAQGAPPWAIDREAAREKIESFTPRPANDSEPPASGQSDYADFGDEIDSRAPYPGRDFDDGRGSADTRERQGRTDPRRPRKPTEDGSRRSEQQAFESEEPFSLETLRDFAQAGRRR